MPPIPGIPWLRRVSFARRAGDQRRRVPSTRFAPSVTYLEGRTLLSLTPTTTSLVASASTFVYGRAVVLTATVTLDVFDTAGTNGPNGGSVTFMDGANPLGTAPVSGATAALPTPNLAAGTHALSAVYSGVKGEFAGSSSQVVAQSIITTVAGDGHSGYGGDGGAATHSELNGPDGVAVDAAGNIYIADGVNAVVRKVDHATGKITTIAGNGTAGYRGDGGPATSAELNNPTAVAVDPHGDIEIADEGNQRIRVVQTSTGKISTIAGTGAGGYSGDGGAAKTAVLDGPYAIAVDAAGDVYIADFFNNVVREINVSTGTITTVAGNGTAGYSGDGKAATSAQLDGPHGLTLDASGNLYIADYLNNVVREVVHATGIISTVAGDGNQGFSGDLGPAKSASLYAPIGVAVDPYGNLFIADSGNGVIRQVDHVSGRISTVAGTPGLSGDAGDGGPASQARLHNPMGLADDASADLFIADAENNRIREVQASPVVTVTPAPLTVTVNNLSMMAGDAVPALTYKITGFVNGDTQASLSTLPTLTTTATSSSPPGHYPIVASGAASPNYAITYIDGTLTVSLHARIVGPQRQRVSAGKHKTMDVIVVQFSAALNDAAARNLANYTLSTAPKGKRHRTTKVALATASYNMASHTVTLTPRSRSLPKVALVLTINTMGVVDASGLPLLGNNGEPGGPYMARV
jgi:sugar lactone lactonase YvrE